MIVECISNESSRYPLTAGENYLVLGISFVANEEAGGIVYQVLSDANGVSHVPASLFGVRDGRCSAFWVAKYEVDGSLLLWPREFFARYFHDDLSEGEIAAVLSFRKVVDELKREAELIWPAQQG